MVAGLRPGHPGLPALGHLLPRTGRARYVEAALADGARVFKVHVQVGGFSPTDPALDQVWGMLSDAGVPVVVHAGHAPVGTAHTGPEQFGELLARHPRLTAVVAHLGAPDYRAFLDLAQAYERVRLDTTMAFTPFFDQFVPFPDDELPRLRELGLSGKVLLGSDFPNIPYPYADQLTGLARLDLGDDWLRAVCWNNAAAMFDLT
ncbi:putative TIM-barrel fold metal-dependent hydrolase [Micromonospora jinlongensis]|uniref:Putative TIM-barrel fold metal-dependent hydrolase n=1 Tax=Micromonospora jinlongensis TaxID=1287877 RepID=A0A7Y9WZP3_9ACTN|nr:putative TIM-barrel fold metal-dependent hydrolase [Micromonospora jinlongensis]